MKSSSGTRSCFSLSLKATFKQSLENKCQSLILLFVFLFLRLKFWTQKHFLCGSRLSSATLKLSMKTSGKNSLLFSQCRRRRWSHSNLRWSPGSSGLQRRTDSIVFPNSCLVWCSQCFFLSSLQFLTNVSVCLFLYRSSERPEITSPPIVGLTETALGVVLEYCWVVWQKPWTEIWNVPQRKFSTSSLHCWFEKNGQVDASFEQKAPNVWNQEGLQLIYSSSGFFRWLLTDLSVNHEKVLS